MFDTITGKATSPTPGTSRWVSASFTVLAHLAVAFVALTALHAADQLPPAAEEVIAYVLPVPSVPAPSTPATPPPPPPPRRSAPKPVDTTAFEPVPVQRDVPVDALPSIPVPVEAPTGLRPETGLEGSLGRRVDPQLLGDVAGVEGGVSGGVAGGVLGAPVAPPPPPKLVRIGGNLAAPKLIHRVNPEYPAVAQSAQVQGMVVLEATVDPNGRVDQVNILRGHPLLQQAAIEAVKQWRYAPLMLNGKPTPFVLSVTVSFALQT